jgi:isopentenyl-diphosphate delta-isomerase
LASGFLGATLIEILLARFKPLLPTPMQLVSSAVFIIFFWLAISMHAGLLAPLLIGSATFAALVVLYLKKHYFFDDKIVFVTEENTPIGTGDKLPSHHSDTKLHRAFSVFLFNSIGDLLMQQRALSKKTWPGVWSNSCCGHVMLHELTESAARRRLKLELGLTGVVLRLALPDFRYRAERDGIVENEICPVLIGFTDDEPRPNPGEVESVKWVNWPAFVASLDDPDIDISPWAIEEAREFLVSPVFKSEYLARTSAGR